MNRISDALAAALRAGREDFNAQFVRARHQYPALSAAAVTDFLVAGVDPVVRAVAAVAPERIADTVAAAYGIGLELVARNLVGPGAKQGNVLSAWQDLLPKAGLLVAAAPGRMLAAVSNAVCQLAAMPGARPQPWLEDMTRLLPVAGWGRNLFASRADRCMACGDGAFSVGCVGRSRHLTRIGGPCRRVFDGRVRATSVVRTPRAFGNGPLV